MQQLYSLLTDVADMIAEITPDSIVSRTLHKDDAMRAILFGFDTGQELSEHTASQAAIIHILHGEASVIVGGDHHELKAGSWLYMTPQLKHSVSAKTPLKMVLYMFSGKTK